ncbi:RluA family pseudouridine synthase [Floccifex sp.]|uniref:RluA family pseudouridine synthase n=1 Tax=Floccifex sp. TaxID=2815810 RepID=UPI003F0514E7
MIEYLELNAYAFRFKIKQDTSKEALLHYFNFSTKRFSDYIIKPDTSFYKKNTTCTIEFPIETIENLIDKPVSILYEDECLIAAYKPPFLLVHDDGNHQDNLQNRVNCYLYNEGHPHSCQAIHRIDTECSGIVLFSKLPFFQGMFDSLIAQHECIKEYYALVQGRIPWNIKTIDMPIGRNRHNAKAMIISKNGKKSISHVKVLKRQNNTTLCKVNIETGRKHQIRVHLSSSGFPIINDPIYGTIIDHRGMLLENYHMAFNHPLYNQLVNIEIPLDDRFNK